MMPFIDLEAQKQRIRPALDAAIARVLDHGQFILGPEVQALEQALSVSTGSPHVLSCSNGTDALLLPLRAWGLGPGDAVFVPSFTFCATAEVVALVGATPVFVDVLPDTFNMDPTALDACIEDVKSQGKLIPRAVIVVDLFGQAAEYDRLLPVAEKHGLHLMVDAAQSFGATWKGRHTTTIGAAATTSFFPAKPLGCYGDGGAIFTADAALEAQMKSLRVHGAGSHRYEHIYIGQNARLDTLQAAILLEKLKIFEEELLARQKIADRYTTGLLGLVQTPVVRAGATSTWAQYTIRLPGGKDHRDSVRQSLEAKGIPTMVYYPIPLHLQVAYAPISLTPYPLTVTEALAHDVMSLPMHPYLTEDLQEGIMEALRDEA